MEAGFSSLPVIFSLFLSLSLSPFDPSFFPFLISNNKNNNHDNNSLTLYWAFQLTQLGHFTVKVNVVEVNVNQEIVSKGWRLRLKKKKKRWCYNVQ